MTSLALRVSNLHHRFAGPVTLDVPHGGCAAITGPSGSGKSLVLRMIADLDPHDGEAWLDARPRAAMPAAEWRRQAIYLAAESGWWADLVGDHFATAERSTAARLAEQLGVRATCLGAQVAHLSTGEKQRLALVRALVKSPRVLLLDEPTAALDTATVACVEAVLSDFLAQGSAMVLVTHDPAQAERLGTTQFRMAAGRLDPA